MNLRSPKVKIQYLLQLLKNEIFRCKSNKYIENLYTESYKKLMKEFKEDLNKWRGMFMD